MEQRSRYRDLTAYTKKLKFPYRLLVEPTLYEKIYDLFEHDSDDPAKEHLVALRLVIPACMMTRQMSDRCEFVFGACGGSDSAQKWEIPVRAAFHSDEMGDYFLLDFGKAEDLDGRPKPSTRSGRALRQRDIDEN